MLCCCFCFSSKSEQQGLETLTRTVGDNQSLLTNFQSQKTHLKVYDPRQLSGLLTCNMSSGEHTAKLDHVVSADFFFNVSRICVTIRHGKRTFTLKETCEECPFFQTRLGLLSDRFDKDYSYSTSRCKDLRKQELITLTNNLYYVFIVKRNCLK